MLKEAAQFNCKTSYVCITEDGSCESMSGTHETKKAKNKEDVYDVLANEMADCWWMFGEGKIDYLGNELLPALYCSICSQIAFDDSIKKIFPDEEINKRQFYEYLGLKKTSTDTSYLEYITGFKTIQEMKDTLTKKGLDFGSLNVNPDKQSYIVMGAYTKVDIPLWIAIGGAVGLAVILTGGGILPFLLISGGGGTAGYFIGTFIEGQSGNAYMTPSIVEANSEDFNKLNCKDIKTLA